MNNKNVMKLRNVLLYVVAAALFCFFLIEFINAIFLFGNAPTYEPFISLLRIVASAFILLLSVLLCFLNFYKRKASNEKERISWLPLFNFACLFLFPIFLLLRYMANTVSAIVNLKYQLSDAISKLIPQYIIDKINHSLAICTALLWAIIICVITLTALLIVSLVIKIRAQKAIVENDADGEALDNENVSTTSESIVEHGEDVPRI